MANINNNPNPENQNIVFGTQTIFAKPFWDVSKIKVYFGNNFWCWQ